jgi:HNH endonuclease
MLVADRAGAIRETDPRLMTAEHVRPMWDGGRTIAGNVVAACYECNQARNGECNQTKRGSKFTIGDDTPISPFAGLQVLLRSAGV